MSEEYSHGTNPIFLIDKIVRTKIYASSYYKEHCFALDAKTMIDRVIEVKYVAGTFGSVKKPSQFLCLLLKLLQIAPDRDIVQKYIESDYKYLRALGCFYLRLVGKPSDVYLTLEPIYNDYRKVKVRTPDGKVIRSFMDEVIDELLIKDIYLEVVLPKIPKRFILEETEGLPLRVSILESELQFEEVEEQQEQERGGKGFEAIQDSFSVISDKPKKKQKLGTGGQNPQKEPAPESDEYWINLRKKLGLAPPKEK